MRTETTAVTIPAEWIAAAEKSLQPKNDYTKEQKAFIEQYVYKISNAEISRILGVPHTRLNVYIRKNYQKPRTV
jgi:predicted XRE-type DNA-binding protein